jgi:hypothetical protein
MKILKPFEEGEGAIEGLNLIDCKHICKCHNVSGLYNYYMQIKVFKKRDLVTSGASLNVEVPRDNGRRQKYFKCL